MMIPPSPSPLLLLLLLPPSIKIIKKHQTTVCPRPNATRSDWSVRVVDEVGYTRDGNVGNSSGDDGNSSKAHASRVGRVVPYVTLRLGLMLYGAP
uniref:Secreted protein n=1 Tax=Vespula pensylvanica TaxID=30213 RepID=A0A834JQ64_VESPE|nr:hypothetical protein H0235_017960 [Vespula pensylvanica]